VCIRHVLKRTISVNLGISLFGGQTHQKISVDLPHQLGESIAKPIVQVIRSEIRAAISEQPFLESLQKADLIDPKEEVAALPDHSNIAPSSNALRTAAKDAMARNAIADACRFIEQADDIEARAETDALKKAERLEFEAQDARTLAVAQSVSRAETQSAYAGILYELNDFDGAKRLYESAIQRLPLLEKGLRDRYAKKLRITLNNIAARAARRDLIRPLLFENAYAAPPDVASYSILIRRAPDYKTAREVLGEMTAAGIAPDVRTSTVCAIFVETRDQASELRTLFREHHVAGTSFHSAVYTKLCKHLAAKELLDWAFSGGGGVPFGAFETAVASYRRQRKISDALRIASAFPYFPTCRKMFREEKPKSLDYLLLRFEGNKEPHNAAYALGIYYEEQGDFSEAIKWLALAQKHPQTLEGKKTIIQRSIEKLQGRR
jgi:tetratricopeptide (TPR) repeat protein